MDISKAKTGSVEQRAIKPQEIAGRMRISFLGVKFLVLSNQVSKHPANIFSIKTKFETWKIVLKRLHPHHVLIAFSLAQLLYKEALPDLLVVKVKGEVKVFTILMEAIFMLKLRNTKS